MASGCVRNLSIFGFGRVQVLLCVVYGVPNVAFSDFEHNLYCDVCVKIDVMLVRSLWGGFQARLCQFKIRECPYGSEFFGVP